MTVITKTASEALAEVEDAIRECQHHIEGSNAAMGLGMRPVDLEPARLRLAELKKWRRFLEMLRPEVTLTYEKIRVKGTRAALG